MTTRLNPYLSFSGNARELVADQIMHSMLVTDAGIALMCVDGFGVPWLVNITATPS